RTRRHSQRRPLRLHPQCRQRPGRGDPQGLRGTREESMKDKILLSGIRFHGYHGLTRMERGVGGRYSIDLELTYDYAKAIASDRIADTLDYRKVHRIVQGIGRGETVRPTQS